MVAFNFEQRGAVTAKGRAVVHEDRETKDWFYPALAGKAMGDDKAAVASFVERLDSPLRIVIEVTPEKWITFNGTKADRMVRGELPREEMGPRLSSDGARMRAAREERGLDPDAR